MLPNKFLPPFLRIDYFRLSASKQRLAWLVQLRIAAALVQLPLTVVGRYYGYLDQATHIVFMLVLMAVLVYSAHLHRQLREPRTRAPASLQLPFQLSLDVLVFTFLLWLSGGEANPLYSGFFVFAVLGGILTAGARTWIFPATLFFCISFIQTAVTFKTPGALSVIFSREALPYISIQLAVPALAYLFARSFGDDYVRGQQRLLALSLRNERMDRLRALGALGAGFSHEFASPLQNAKLRLRRFLGANTPDPEDLSECMQSLDDCTLVLHRMNTQLSLAERDLEVVDLNSLLRETVNLWSETTPDASVQISGSAGKVRLNRVNFTQALFNLLDNAKEASQDRSPSIAVRLSEAHTGPLLAIEDQGPGFRPEILMRLGEPFTTSKEAGTGLGLYSAILFMTSVGGTLRAFNRAPTGARVELAFPREDHS